MKTCRIFFIHIFNLLTRENMRSLKTIIRSNYKWLLFLVLLSYGSLASEFINHRFEMADLEVYYKTAWRMIEGEGIYRDVESDPYEHYVYKYSPPAAILFMPLATAGFPAARHIYWALLTFIFGSVLYNMKTIFNRPFLRKENVTFSLILATLVVGTHFFRELHLGQVNLLLLGIYIYALFLYLSGKHAGFGALLAVSIFIKPFGLIFLPLLIVRRRFREVLWFVGWSVVLFFLPLFFYHDPGTFKGLYVSWFNEMAIELGNKQSFLEPGNHTIFAVLVRYSPLRWVQMGETGKLIYQLVILGGIAFLILWFLFRRRIPGGEARIFIALTAMIPLLAFTSYNAFIFTLPLVVFLMLNFRGMKPAWKVVFITSCLLIGANIYDLTGRQLFDFLWEISVYTWGTAGLLLVMFGNWSAFPLRNKMKNELFA